MSCALTQEEAVRLYSILDDSIGVFREENMTEGALKFYERKKNEFIELFTTEIPEDYWFQGAVCSSASLVFDSVEGLHVVPTTSDRKVEKIVEEVVNPVLAEVKFFAVNKAAE